MLSWIAQFPDIAAPGFLDLEAELFATERLDFWRETGGQDWKDFGYDTLAGIAFRWGRSRGLNVQLVAYSANASPANRIFMPIKMEMAFRDLPTMYLYIHNDEEAGDSVLSHWSGMKRPDFLEVQPCSRAGERHLFNRKIQMLLVGFLVPRIDSGSAGLSILHDDPTSTDASDHEAMSDLFSAFRLSLDASDHEAMLHLFFAFRLSLRAFRCLHYHPREKDVFSLSVFTDRYRHLDTSHRNQLMERGRVLITISRMTRGLPTLRHPLSLITERPSDEPIQNDGGSRDDSPSPDGIASIPSNITGDVTAAVEEPMKGGDVVVKQSETAAKVSVETASSKVSLDADTMESDTEPFQQEHFSVVEDRMDEDHFLDTRLDSQSVHGPASGSANIGLHPTAMDHNGHDHSSNHSYFGVSIPLPPVTLPSNALLQMSPMDVSVAPETPSASKAPSLDAFEGEAMSLSKSSYANIDLGDGHSGAGWGSNEERMEDLQIGFDAGSNHPDTASYLSNAEISTHGNEPLQSPLNAVQPSENATQASPRSFVDHEEPDIDILTQSGVRRASEQAPAPFSLNDNPPSRAHGQDLVLANSHHATDEERSKKKQRTADEEGKAQIFPGFAQPQPLSTQQPPSRPRPCQPPCSQQVQPVAKLQKRSSEEPSSATEQPPSDTLPPGTDISARKIAPLCRKYRDAKPSTEAQKRPDEKSGSDTAAAEASKVTAATLKTLREAAEKTRDEENQRNQQYRLVQIFSGTPMDVMIRLRQQALFPQDATEIYQRWVFMQIRHTTSYEELDMLTSDATPEFRNQAFDYRSSLYRESSRLQQRVWHTFQAEQNRLLGVAPQ